MVIGDETCAYTIAHVFVFISTFPSMACTGGFRLLILEGAKLGRDTEGTENQDTYSNMATRGLGKLASWCGGMVPGPLNPPVMA